jgi:hypothetical protein
MDRRDDEALKRVEEDRRSYDTFRLECSEAKRQGGRATFADFLRKHPPSGYRMRWRDHTGSQRSTAPSQHFMNALRTKLGGIELMDAQCDNYLNPVAEGEGGKTTKKG